MEIYDTSKYSLMSIAELEERKEDMKYYMSRLPERYPRASGHPFTSDPKQLEAAQAERDAFHKAMLAIDKEIWERTHKKPTLN